MWPVAPGAGLCRYSAAAWRGASEMGVEWAPTGLTGEGSTDNGANVQQLHLYSPGSLSITSNSNVISTPSIF